MTGKRPTAREFLLDLGNASDALADRLEEAEKMAFGEHTLATEWQARAEKAECEVKRLTAAALRLLQMCGPPGDWACSDCRPKSSLIEKGFRCAYHNIAALREPDNG